MQRVHGAELEVSKEQCAITKPSNDPTGTNLPPVGDEDAQKSPQKSFTRGFSHFWSRNL